MTLPKSMPKSSAVDNRMGKKQKAALEIAVTQSVLLVFFAVRYEISIQKKPRKKLQNSARSLMKSVNQKLRLKRRNQERSGEELNAEWR